MRSLLEDLEAAAAFHGHLCSGMVLGVRMARLALNQLGIQEPHRYRDLVVYVEMDRCASDAVSVVTGCTLGRRRLKWVDYGKMAATFVDLASGRAIRVSAGTKHYSPGEDEDLLQYWEKIPDEAIFRIQTVLIEIRPEDMPGRPLRAVTCAACGEQVRDRREIIEGGQCLCRACAGGAYYRLIEG